MRKGLEENQCTIFYSSIIVFYPYLYYKCQSTSVCLSVRLSRQNHCTGFNEILHRGTQIFEERYRLLFAAITDRHADEAARISQYCISYECYKKKYRLNIIQEAVEFVLPWELLLPQPLCYAKRLEQTNKVLDRIQMY